MLRDEQLRLLKVLQHGLENDVSADAGGTRRAPVNDYTCPDLAVREQQTLFRETPLLLGLSPDLPAPGTYLATSEVGVPILMTRGDDGAFRAFLNVCRHRGVQVVQDGRGERSRFSCPFHAWTYANTGDLIAINRERKVGCIDKATHGLVELPAAEKHGMLWVKPSPGGTVDVDASLGGLAKEMAHWQLDRLVFQEEQVLAADINWKLAIDTFGENYHFDVLHRETLASEIHGNLQTSDAFGSNYRMVFANTHFSELAAQTPPSEWRFRDMTLSVYFFYPNTIFLVDAINIDLLRMYPDPDNPGRSLTHHKYFAHPEVLAMIAKYEEDTGQAIEPRFEGFNRIVVDEDYAMATSIQRSAGSGAQTHYIFGRNEPALHHYHNAHRRGLGLPELELIKD